MSDTPQTRDDEMLSQGLSAARAITSAVDEHIAALLAENARFRSFARRINNEHYESDGQCVTCRDWADNPADWPCVSGEALAVLNSSPAFPVGDPE